MTVHGKINMFCLHNWPPYFSEMDDLKKVWPMINMISKLCPLLGPGGDGELLGAGGAGGLGRAHEHRLVH